MFKDSQAKAAMIYDHATGWQHATACARNQMASFLFANLTKSTVAHLRGRLEPEQPQEIHPWFSKN
jgi:hypothetical protein